MCGLVAVASQNPLDATALHQFGVALGHLQRRGPDGYAAFRGERALLGQTYLQVYDPSLPLRCHISRCGRYVCLHNGFIYNAPSLRERFTRTREADQDESDVQVIADLYSKFGNDVFELLDGHYAVVIYDRHEHRLVLSRDRAGQRPLYFGVSNGLFAVSSLPTNLIRAGLLPSSPDPRAPAFEAVFRQPIGTATMFEQLDSVEPGGIVEWTARGTRSQSSARPVSRPREQPARATERLTLQVERALAAATRKRIPDRVEYAAFLSGGVDSSVLQSMMVEGGVPARLSITCGFDATCAGLDERESARRVAEAIGLPLDECSLDRDEFAILWPLLIEELGAPLMFSSALAIHTMARRIRQAGCRVAISGEGADELFLGYERHARALRDREPRSLDDILELHEEIVSPSLARCWFRDEQAFMRSLEAAKHDVYSDPRQPDDLLGLELLRSYDRRHFLTGLLRRADAACLGASVSCRMPFLDRDVMNQADELPVASHVRRERGKWHLRSILSRRLGAHWMDKPKVGFPVPVVRWLLEQRSARLLAALEGALRASPTYHAIDLRDALASARTPKAEMQAWTLCNAAAWAWRTQSGVSWIEEWREASGSPDSSWDPHESWISPPQAPLPDPALDGPAVVWSGDWRSAPTCHPAPSLERGKLAPSGCSGRKRFVDGS